MMKKFDTSWNAVTLRMDSTPWLNLGPLSVPPSAMIQLRFRKPSAIEANLSMEMSTQIVSTTESKTTGGLVEIPDR